MNLYNDRLMQCKSRVLFVSFVPFSFDLMATLEHSDRIDHEESALKLLVQFPT